ncbi:F-box/FBD/LRR-repeat protein [Spatholobus suberectus]|nr:F-box/FBD/LRR-repeat protein [Spatholobus suberectus]
MEESSDSNVIGSSTSKEKLSKRVKAKEGVDGITSKLPESLISHILSFLPAKDAVRTSVLSKRWMYHWTSITKLDLDDSVFYSPKKKTGGKQFFVNFVYRALLLTKSPSMESFSLEITNKYDASLVNTWISGILNRNVKNLHIYSHFEVSFNAYTSYSLFDSEVLEELVLKMINTIRVPITFVHFGHLKLLKLCSIVFALESSSSSEDLTLSLPVLKVFETINCTWLNAKSVTLRAPLLESVLVEHDPEAIFYELDYLPIKISALCLKKIAFCSFCYISQNLVLLDPSSARNASANIILHRCNKDSVSETGSHASSLLRQFSEVKCLKFDGPEVLPPSESHVAILPVFGMLSRLELGFVTAEFLLALLLRSPVLKTLAFKGIYKFDKELLNSATVPHCLTSTLQLVKFGKVHGLEHELCLAKFVMENGLAMERMSFSLTSHRLAKSKIIEQFKDKLFSFKKGFSFAIVEFSCD